MLLKSEFEIYQPLVIHTYKLKRIFLIFERIGIGNDPCAVVNLSCIIYLDACIAVAYSV